MKHRSKTGIGALAWLLTLLVAASDVRAAEQAGQEIAYPGEAFAKLDTFEGVNLEDADKQYTAGDIKGAYAAYKAYSFEFPKSKALPYVLLRLGRCLHKLDKRNAAITAYQDVVDYFPDDVRYAGAGISVDMILSSIAEALGLEVEAILVLPGDKGNSSQQMGQHGRAPLRKCVYVWRKPQRRTRSPCCPGTGSRSASSMMNCCTTR